MKNALIKLFLPVFILSVIIMAAIDSLAAGTGADPLISLSYMNNTVRTQLTEYAAGKINAALLPGSRTDTVDAAGQDALDTLALETIAEAVSQLLLNMAELPAEIPAVNRQREVDLSALWEMTAGTGCTVYVKSGTLTANIAQGKSIIDINKKTEITAQTALGAGDYVIVSEKGSVSFIPGENGAVVFVTGAVTYAKPLSGTISVFGSAVFGQRLTLVTALQTPCSTYDCVWKRDGAVIASGTEYTLGAQDIGKNITVTVSGSGIFSGSLTSAAVVPVKAAQGSSAAPTLASKTYNSVTLASVSGCEYRRDSGAWQASPVFTGLTANTSYSFYTRKAETATHAAGAQSAALSVVTNPASMTSQKFTVNSSAGIVSKIDAGLTVSEFISGMSYPDYIKVYSGTTLVPGSARIGTGMTVKLVIDGNVLQTLSVVVTGDVNGDGIISLTDFVKLKAHLLGKETLTGAFLKAADINGDGGVTLTDFVKTKAHLLGKETIVGKGY